MATGEVYTYRNSPTLKGINNALSDEGIDGTSEWSDARNYEPDTTGVGWVRKRAGLTRVSSEKTATAYSIYDGIGNYYHNGTAIFDFAGTSLKSSITAAYDSWITFTGYDCYVNGTDAYKTNDSGSTWSTWSGVPSGTKYVATVNNLVYAAGHAYGKLRWGNLGALSTWPATNELSVTQQEGSDIGGLCVGTNALMVACARSMYQVTGYGTRSQEISWQSSVEGLTGSHRSLVMTPYGMFFWGRSGLTLLNGSYQYEYPMVQRIPYTLSQINRGYDSIVHGVWDSRNLRVMMFVPYGSGQTTINMRIDYYPAMGAFFLHNGTGTQMSVSGTAIISGSADVYVSGYSSSTYLYKVLGNLDDATAISSYFETGRISDPSIERMARKTILTTKMGAATDAITYSVYVDNETSIAANNTWTVTPGTSVSETTIGVNRLHKKLKHRVSDSATTASQIMGLENIGYVVGRV